MVTAPDSSNHHSPTSAGLSASASDSASADNNNSPKFPRKNLPSPWAQVVRGADPEPLSAIHQSPPSSSSSSSSLATSTTDQPPSSSDSSPKAAPATSLPPPLDNSNTVAPDSSDANNGNAGRPQRPVWNRPANGEVAPVMGAVSWPALSKSIKPSPKSPADSSSKDASDGSLPSSQGSGTSHSPQKQATSNAISNPATATNQSMPNRPRSTKRGGGNNYGPGYGPAQSSFSNSSQAPPFSVVQFPPSSFGNGVPGVQEPSPRDPHRNNNWDTRPPVGGFVPVINEHRSSSRRGNLGHHPRGDGSYHNNYGNRRDHDRGNFASIRDAHIHQQRMIPRVSGGNLPPNTASFGGPQSIVPFANPGYPGFPEFYYFPTLPFEYFKGMPFFTHGPPPAMFYPVAESPLTHEVVNQIDYYFSDANLVKDRYLKSNMDEQGWVPITLIASFPRVRSLTSNIQFILDALRTSTVVELQGDKLRRRYQWMKWLPSAQLWADSGSISPGGSSYRPIADFQKVNLEETTTGEGNSDPSTEAFAGRYPAESVSSPNM